MRARARATRKPAPLTLARFAAQVGGFPLSMLASAKPPVEPSPAATRAARALLGDVPTAGADRDRVCRVAVLLDRLVALNASPATRAR